MLILESSRRRAVVVVQESAETMPRIDSSTRMFLDGQWENRPIADSLMIAFPMVMLRADQESIETFEGKLGDNLYKLWSRMESGSYFPPPVKAVPIPKKSGGTRILGVPTVADRVAQTVVKAILEPMLEPVFDVNSYGYRPGRSALDAVAVVRRRN